MSGDFEFIGGHYLRQISETEVHLGVLFTERVRVVPARTVVLVSYNQPNLELKYALEALGIDVHLVGDVRGRNSLMTAIQAAVELGRWI